MSSKKKKNPKNEIINDKKISSVIEVKEKDNKIVYVLILLIAILLGLLIFFAIFNKKECEECKKCDDSPIEIEVEPKYQLINFAGFRFKMPLNWDFVSDNSTYTISDNESKIFISFEEIKEDYEIFSSTDYQLNFLEKIQTSDNIKIDKSEKLDKYYLYEGKYNDYNYLIIAVGNDKKTVLVKTQFIDKLSFDNEKNNIIEFVLTSIKKSEE